MGRRRGIALVLVTLVMALAAVLGYAMLSASSVQATASENASEAAIARAEAESGVHLAMYELLNNASLTLPANWSNVTFSTVGATPTAMPGSVTVAIGALTNHCCQIVSTGSSGGGSGGGAVTRTITAEVQVGTPLVINEAGAFNAPVTVGANATFTSSTAGAPAVAGAGGVTNSGHINGNVTATSFAGNAPSGGTFTSVTATPAPSSGASVTNYALPYVYQGATYNPTLISGTVSAITSYGPTISNPLGIYYTTGNLTVTKALTVNGTLVVGGTGTLTTTAAINITAPSTQANCYLPALVVAQKIMMSGHTAALTAQGVVYADAGIYGTGTSSATNITINGALVVTANALNSTYTGTLAVTYNPSYAYVPTFDAADWDSTSGVKIISWSE